MSFLSRETLGAAMGAINMSATELSSLTGVSRVSISKFLQGETESLKKSTSEKFQTTFENRGIELLEYGARLNQGSYRIQGRDGFVQLYEDIYSTIKNGGYFYLLSCYSDQFKALLGDEYLEKHIARMTEVKDIVDVRAITPKSDLVQFGSGYAQYKWIPEKDLTEGAVFIYNGKVVFIAMDGEHTVGTVHADPTLEKIEKRNYHVMWDYAAREFTHDPQKPL